MLDLTAVNGGVAISVIWDTPMDDVVIDYYEVMYVVSEQPAAGETVNSTTESHVITGLMQGVVYSVWVRAVSVVGGHAGEYSEVESITAPVGEKCSFFIRNGCLCALISLLHNHPSHMKLQCILYYTDVLAPTIDVVTSGENSISLQWSPPSEGSPLSYTVTWAPSRGTSSSVLHPAARSYTIRGLDSNTAYSGTVEVYALTNNATVRWEVYTLPQGELVSQSNALMRKY